MVADILGYRNIIKRVESDYGEIDARLNHFVSAYHAAVEELRASSMAHWNVRLFSDNLFLEADLQLDGANVSTGRSKPAGSSGPQRHFRGSSSSTAIWCAVQWPAACRISTTI